MPSVSKSIKTKLDRFNSNIWHFHVVIPQKIGNLFIEGTNRRVVCLLNKTESFQAALMPLGDGNYFININQTIRKKLKLNDGDDVLVDLEKDNSEFGLPMPEEFAALLKQDLDGADEFFKLTLGKQRSLLYIIAKPKSADLRIRNGIGILTHLKNTHGKINYKVMMEDIKNA
jgi:hypothetical protein